MAHGHMNESPLYICTKGGKFIVRKEDGCLGEHYFSENDVVGCDGHKYVSMPDFNTFRETGHPTSRWVRFREGMNIDDEKCWYELNTGYYGESSCRNPFPLSLLCSISQGVMELRVLGPGAASGPQREPETVPASQLFQELQGDPLAWGV